MNYNKIINELNHESFSIGTERLMALPAIGQEKLPYFVATVTLKHDVMLDENTKLLAGFRVIVSDLQESHADSMEDFEKYVRALIDKEGVLGLSPDMINIEEQDTISEWVDPR